MGVRVTVKELVETFEDTYSAIDIRTAAVLVNEQWVSALTVVRLTYEDPVVAAARLRGHEDRHGKVQTKHLQIEMGTRPFLEWKSFWENVGNGVLRVNGSDIKLRRPLALNDQTNQLEASSWDIRSFDRTDWPNLRLQIGRSVETELINELLTREVSTLSGSAQEFVKDRILGCFPQGDEFSLGRCHALGLQ